MVYNSKKRHEVYLRDKEKNSQTVKNYYKKNRTHLINKAKKHAKINNKKPEVKERKKKQMKDWYSKNKEHHLEKMKEYNQKPEVREKLIIRWETYRLFRNQLGDKCSKCSSMESLEIHHGNYKDFTIENCTLLCRACHRRLHVKE